MNKELQDLTWSVLPKEFKEEVKKIYSTLLANIKMYQGDNPEQVGTTYPILWERTLGIKNTLCRIFGEYNLTSDADGEDDEILHVSRKKLQYFYEKLRKVGESHAAFALQNLFGSKCLPDESESPKLSKVEKVGKDCNVDSLPTNVDSSDDCKAEPKFKVGDIVRFKYCCTTYQIDGFKILDGVMLYQVGEVWAEESDIEPYIEPDTSHETLVCENHSDDTSQKAEKEVMRMKPIKAKVRVYLATKEEDEEFRLLLHENGFTWNSGDSLIDSSMWESDIESVKIHFFYPDKTVTYDGNKTPDTLTFSEFKKQYFGEETSPNVNNSDIDIAELVAKGYVANPAKQFDTILKDSFRNERRLNIATQIMSAILSNQMMLNNLAHGETTVEGAVRCVVDATMMYTDALIAECEKGGSDGN